MNMRTLMLGCTALLLASLGLPGATADVNVGGVTLPSGGDCEFNAGDCDGGSCYVNAGYCAGTCYINVGNCEDGGSCTVNAGSCSLQETLLGAVQANSASADPNIPPILVLILPSGDCEVNAGDCDGGSCYVNTGYCSGSCYVNTDYCSGSCTINAGNCYSSGSCYLNVGTCRSTLLGLLEAGAVSSVSVGPIPPLPDVYTPGGHGGDCQINAGDCNGGSCYFNAGSCSGSCTWNVGVCEDGGSCYVNAGSCTTQETLLGLLTAQAAAGIPPVVTVGVAGGDCEVNLGDCDGGSCYLNAGYCGGSCTWNTGFCEEGASCYVNVGSCRAQMELLALIEASSEASSLPTVTLP